MGRGGFASRQGWTFVIGLLLYAALASRAAAEPPPSASPHRYAIDATLDPKRREVHGSAQIRFTNTSARPLGSLLFHLYLNAFRDQQSVFMRESGGSLRGTRFRTPGKIRLQSLKVARVEVLDRAERELIAGDRTQLRVPLASPLPPGAQLVIEARFTSQLPRVFARSGYEGNFFAVAQWFPKLAKLEPDGEFAGFPYHALGEFYADFADYELTLRTPASFVVGATGRLVRETQAGEQSVRVFAAERVHDAAWVASPNLHMRRERLSGTEVIYLAPPGHELALEEHASIVRAGLARFGRLFGAYPYPTLTVVLPPRGAEGAAGMEYPSLIFTAGTWLPTPWSPGISGEFVTAHELAHQWFYGLLASNEVRWPVLDEGFAQWAALDLLRARHGERGAVSAFSPFSRFELERTGALIQHAGPPGLSAYAYGRNEYGASVYARAAVALESVRRAHGKARFEAALQRYASAQRFRHPVPADLASVFDSVYGAGFGERVVLPLLIDGERSDVRIVEASSGKTQGQDKPYVTSVRARRSGGVRLPTWVAAYDARGRELTRVPWPSDVETLYATFDTRDPVTRVVADPDRALLVDADVRDQIVVFDPQSPGLLSRVIGLGQLLLGWLGP